MTTNIHSLWTPAREARPLEGIGVVVTRPQRQAAALAMKIASLGGVPIVWPAIVILPPLDKGPLERAHASVGDYDIAIFVSPNAVEYGAPPAGTWPHHIDTYAPGQGTADALCGAGIPNARIPVTSPDSEGLLELPSLADVTGKRIVIFRGEGGRQFLGNALRARGAKVDHVPCYRRVAPESGADGLIEAMRDGRVHALTLTSSEGADNLVAALGPAGCELVSGLPVFASHPRIAERVRDHKLKAIETAGGDAGLLAGLLDWFAARPQPGAARSA